MRMPETDGVALAAWIHACAPHATLPLILPSPLGERVTGDLAAHFANQLVKPVKPAQLHRALALIFSCPAESGSASGAKPPEKPQRGSDSAPPKGLRILLADDNAVNQRVALLMLKRLGYRADAAANGLEVLDALARHRYDVVLMDMHMPEMDGLEATRRIRASLPPDRQPYIIAMTAAAFAEDREQCIEAGMNDFITKPVRNGMLVQALEGVDSADSAARASNETREVLDPEILAELCGYFKDEDASSFRDFVNAYIEDTARQLEDLRRASYSCDYGRVSQLAHALKGTAAMYGATRLGGLLRDIEMAVRHGGLDNLGEMLADVAAEFLVVKERLLEIAS
jgi:CheY-like chemotaxis protein/HPt (histidine-containing phosphotransfer) domain-containing protein